MGDADCDGAHTRNICVHAAHVRRHCAGIRHRIEQTIVVGIFGARIDRPVSDIGELGMAMPAHTQMVPGAQISVDILADRHDSGDDWTGLLCILANTTKLPYRAFGVAHVDGIEHSVSAAQSKIIFAKMLAHTDRRR